MATAVANSKTLTDAPTRSIWAPSLLGAAIVLGGLALILQGIPQLWASGVAPTLQSTIGNSANAALRVVAQFAGAFAVLLALRALGGAFPGRGLRGGIALSISLIIAGFFLARAAIMIVQRLGTEGGVNGGNIFSLIVVGLGLYLTFVFVNSGRMKRWSLGLEDAGWFSMRPYKRTQGTVVRRFTLLGFLIIFGCGIATLVRNNILTTPAEANGNWILEVPYVGPTTILPSVAWTLPVLLAIAAIWLAWRIVNYPVFADFLIATEAEMNKVSWTTRRNLIKDTIVVLVTLFVITAFLFVVDVFWGFILSREVVGILPTNSDKKQFMSNKVQSKEIPW